MQRILLGFSGHVTNYFSGNCMAGSGQKVESTEKGLGFWVSGSRTLNPKPSSESRVCGLSFEFLA